MVKVDELLEEIKSVEKQYANMSKCLMEEYLMKNICEGMLDE